MAAFSLLVGVGSSVPVAAMPNNGISNQQAVQWTPCEGAPTTPLRECAIIQVPLDYSDLSKGTTDLQLARVKASNPAQYQGSLLVLPGGPPSAGVSYLGYTADLSRSVAPELQAAYDLIGIEQIGAWNGIPCMSGDPLKQYWEANHLPKNNAQLHSLMGLEKAFNDGCAQPSNTLVPYMNTSRSIRDIETVRQALQVSQFNMLAFSYGTALAHGYMTQYPSHVRRVVLDSVVDRSIPDWLRDKENNMAFDKSWTLFKQWCQSSSDCSLQGQNLDQLFDGALAVAKTTGIPAPRNLFGTAPLNDWELTVAMEALTGSGEATRIWAATVLEEAAAGDGSQGKLLYDLLTGRQLDGSYSGGDGTRRAYSCNDSTWSQVFQTPEDVKQWADATQAFAPRYGAASVYQGVAQCYKWSFAPVNPPPRAGNVTGNPAGALLINATDDSSTPLVWAQRVKQQINGAKLVTVTGASHLQISRSRCATNHAKQYLLTGAMPANGATCTYDADLMPPQLPPDLGPIAQFSAPQAPAISQELLEQMRQRF